MRKRPAVVKRWRLVLPPDAVRAAISIALARSLDPETMFDGTPDQDVVEARWHLMLSMRKDGHTFQKIGDLLGVHHSTVINAVSKLSTIRDQSGPGGGPTVPRGIGREFFRYRQGAGSALLD